MRRRLALWAELLRLSFRIVPVLTCIMFGVLALSVVAVAAAALELRNAIDGTVRGDTALAVGSALGAALAYGLHTMINGMRGNLRILLVEKVAMTELSARITRDIAAVEGMDHLENPEYLDRVTVVSGAAWGIMDGLWAVVDSVANVLQLAVCLVLLGAVSPWLLILLLFAAAPLWFDQRGQRAVRQAEIDTAEQFRLQKHLFDLATSAAEGKEIRVAGAGAELARRQGDAWNAAQSARLRARLVAAGWKLAGWGVFIVAFAAALALVVYRARNGHGTTGDVVLTITIAANLRQAVQATVNRAADTAGARRLTDPYLWLRDFAARERELRSESLAVPEKLRRGIELDRVSFTYPGTERRALDDVSMYLPAGSIVAVVGEYGSGKTTLIKLLAKFHKPDGGAIRVDGVDLARLDTGRWRAGMAAAFQDFGRFHIDLGEAVGLGDPEQWGQREPIEQAVLNAGAGDLLARLPDGLDTQLGREFGGVDLSEGQWQKTALARATMRPAPVLFVLDEPTASLDAPSEHEIFERYMARARALAKESGAITMIVSHRFSTVTGADLILVLAAGKLVEAGTHKDLMELGGRYAELYGIQETAYTAT
jgi:ATP-binding cassette subfamily B protein